MKIRTWPFVILAVIAVLLVRCFNITDVIQPLSAIAGEEISITVNVEILDDPNNEGIGVSGSEFVFGFLAPKSWNANENSTISISSAPFSNTLILMDPGELEPNEDIPWVDALEKRVGIGANYGEMEWIMYKATESYNPPPTEIPLTGTVDIVTKVGPENMITQLGYFVGDNELGIWDINKNFSFFFTECMEVTGGEGITKDLCGSEPEATTLVTSPEVFSWNDLIKLSFDATKGPDGEPTILSGAGRVYLCATAHYDGGTAEVCDAGAASELTSEGGDQWKITIWPTSFFDIPDGEVINEVTLSFRNNAGDLIVIDPVTDEPFRLIAECN